MLKRFWQRWRQRPFTCTDVDANVEQVRDGRLSARETAAFKAHVAACATCRQRLKTETAWLSTLQATPAPARLTPHERRAMQQALGQQMRRGMIMRNIRLSVQQIAVLGVLALVVGAMVWWQTADNLTNEDSNSETVVAANPISSFEEEITVYFSCPAQDIERFTALADIFHEQNPSIRIEIISLDDVRDNATNQDIDHRVMSRVDTAYYWLTYEGVIDGSFLDLKPLIEEDKNFDTNDFFPNTLSAFEYEGGIWALPSDIRVSYLLYDKQIFDEAEVAYPTIGWTKQDFLSATQETTSEKAGGTRYGFLDTGLARSAFIPFFSNTEAHDNTSLVAESTIEDVRWYVDLALLYNVMPVISRTGEGFELASELLNQKGVAMWQGWWLDYEQSKEDRGISLFPTEEGSRALGQMYGYVISSGTQHPEESWKWLRFLSYQTTADGHLLPPRRSAAEASGYWQQFDSQDIDFVQLAAENLLFASPIKPGGQQLHTAIYSILEGTPIEEALTNAELQLEERITALSANESITVESPAEERDVTIQFALADDKEIYSAQVEEFQEIQKDIQVNLLQSGQKAESDCFVDTNVIDQMEPPHDLLNLESFLAVEDSIRLDDFHPALLESLRSQGDLYGLPLQAQARVIFYNTSLFDEAGIDYPRSDWTLEDFLVLAIALTEKDQQDIQYGFLPINGDISDLRVFLFLQGASTTDLNGLPNLDSLQMRNALQWYADLALENSVSPLFPVLNDPGAYQERSLLVQKGSVAMWSDFVGIDRHSTWPEETTVGIAPLPTGVIRGTEFLTEGLFIATDTPHAEECWEWIKFLAQQPELVQAMPARFSVFNSPEFAINAQLGEIETYQAMKSYSNLLTKLDEFAHYDWAIQALEETYAGSNPGAALERAQTQAEQ